MVEETIMKKIMVIGGDGFCGWPTSLHLANAGHEVHIVDNLSRRKIDLELSSGSLTPIASISDRISTANKLIGNIAFTKLDVARENMRLRELIAEFQPESIIHFGEQRAAPYSMISDIERRYTVDNNVSGTHNLCSAIVDLVPNCHLVHLGTMGVYGYTEAFGEIPEGYLNIRVNQTNTDTDILYPANPGSVYHMTKCLDQLILQFYNKNWGLRATDLHQGIVWGVNTRETSLDPRLNNRFDYDGIYGTVLNRFLVQSANNIPMSVYGTGGQSRAFINIADTAKCIRLAIENDKFSNAKVRIFNQVAEVHNVKGLAEIIQKLTGCEINFLENPRKELKENQLFVSNSGLKSLGFEPILLSDGLLEDIQTIAKSTSTDRLNPDNINNSPLW